MTNESDKRAARGRPTPVAATILSVGPRFAFAETDEGSSIFVPHCIVSSVDMHPSQRCEMTILPNTTRRGGERPTDYFTTWVRPAPAPLPECDDVPNHDGKIYLFREDDGEWAWGDEPPAGDETAYVFRFEGVATGETA